MGGSACGPTVRAIVGRGPTLVLAAVLATACGAGPSSSTPTVVEPSPSPAAASSTSAAGAGLGPPSALVRADDQPSLRGAAVIGPTVVGLPDGSFLMLRKEDSDAGGVLLHSADGTKWSVVPGSVPGTGGTRVETLASNGTELVMTGGTPPAGGGSIDDYDPAAWTSTDGITWQPEPEAVVAGMTPSLFAATPGAFLAVDGPTGAAWLGDPGGRSWMTTRVMPGLGSGVSINGIARAGDGFVAVGDVNGLATAWRSADGHAWRRLPFNPPNASGYRIAAVGERFVISGSVTVADPTLLDGETLVAAAWLSTDGGTTWRGAGLDLAGDEAVAVFAAGNGFLAFGMPHLAAPPTPVWRSPGDGTWEAVRLADGDKGLDRAFPSSVAVQGSRVVVAGSTIGTGAGGDRAVVWIGDAR